MGSESDAPSSGTWYMRGSRPSDRPPVIHATQPRGDGLFAALCDAQAVIPLPDHFDPAAADACPRCATMVS